MQLVVDANIVIAAIIKKNITRRLLSLERLELYVPEKIFAEIEENRLDIRKKNKQSDEEFDEFINDLFTIVKPVSVLDFYQFMPFARRECPDQKDTMYFALAMHLNCPLWSNENRLKNQKTIKVYSTEDIITLTRI